MKSNELISIIIPVYNSEKYIEECLISVIEQSYKNIEIIIVNDGSTDKSYEICKIYMLRDPRIRLFSQNNKGSSAARNFALSQMKGKYFTCIDSDDTIKKNMIYNLYSAIKSERCDISIENNSLYKKNTKKNIYYEKENILEEFFLEKNFWTVLHGKLIKSCLVENIRFDEKMSISEDFKFLYYVFLNSKKIVLISQKEYIYNIRDDSLSHSNFNYEKWKPEFDFVNNLIEIYWNNYELRKCLISRYLRVNANIILKFNLEKCQFKKIKNQMNKYKKYFFINNKSSIKEKIKIIGIYYFCFLK